MLEICLTINGIFDWTFYDKQKSIDGMEILANSEVKSWVEQFSKK